MASFSSRWAEGTPIFQDDVAPRRMAKRIDSHGATTSFVIGAPVLSESAHELVAGHKKQYQGHAAQGAGWQQAAARDPSMYQTVANGGQVAGTDRHALHANGTRKFTTKRMVVPAAAQNYHTRLLNAQSSGTVLSTVDRRIASFAGSFAGLAPSK